MLNLVSISFYILISFYITIFIGYKCYKIGDVYLLNFIKNVEICKSINHTLLIGYYLVNLGYIAYSIHSWQTVKNISQGFLAVSTQLSTILIILCVLHYANIAGIYFLRKKQNINL
ncbi:hypothetical protein [Frigoriflavimonas asaccharolytica]|uniref:Uncharacterized protein n=1 Tax=Frigoriflavimonas asaccharolytica TaxID=2735899 RepID=A0A8J8G4S2_9FLAO|nr:hypothetical protein [Frigoriflavimonas asaccharolytica]NRS91254.1 hypothetical protein [Frigoriflavimonas asaccharolytica]